jgi:protein disulfide-isomerase A6
MALMHGGFTNMVDFEQAMLAGGADYHDTHGYGGMMGDIPESLKKAKAPETPSMSVGSAPITEHPATTTANVNNTPESAANTPQPTKVASPKDEL